MLVDEVVDPGWLKEEQFYHGFALTQARTVYTGFFFVCFSVFLWLVAPTLEVDRAWLLVDDALQVSCVPGLISRT